MTQRGRGSTIAVTGAAGYVASRLIEQLQADERVDRILGFDVRPPSSRASKLVFDEMDVRNPEFQRRLAGVDVLVHLAFVMDPIHNEALMRDVNVNGSQNAFFAAGRAGVRKIVYTSSATVYGAHPDNDFPLTEESPLRANLDFSYPAHKLEVEYVLRDFKQEFPRVITTVFRPAIVFGPHADNAWSRALEFPLLLGVQGTAAPIQFVHEDDLADALVFAIEQDLDGYYNVAADGFLEAEEALLVVGKRRIELPEPAAFALADRLWAGGAADAPAGMLHYLMHPWVVATDKLAGEGFSARRSNHQALVETCRHAREHVRIGRARLRRGDLTRGAAGAGTVALLAGLWALRRRTASRV